MPRPSSYTARSCHSTAGALLQTTCTGCSDFGKCCSPSTWLLMDNYHDKKNLICSTLCIDQIPGEMIMNCSWTFMNSLWMFVNGSWIFRNNEWDFHSWTYSVYEHSLCSWTWVIHERSWTQIIDEPERVLNDHELKKCMSQIVNELSWNVFMNYS